MTEAFDNKPPRTAEILKLPQRIKILADAIIELTGAENPYDRENTKESEWNDARTNTTVTLQRRYINDATHYFLNHYNTPYIHEEGVRPVKQYSAGSPYKFEVMRGFAETENDGPTPEEECSNPAEEFYDFLLHGPLANSKGILKEHEKPEVEERFRHLIGTYAISDENIVEKINKAQQQRNPKKKNRAIAEIANQLTYQYHEDKLTVKYAYKAINRYIASNPYSPPESRWPKR